MTTLNYNIRPVVTEAHHGFFKQILTVMTVYVLFAAFGAAVLFLGLFAKLFYACSVPVLFLSALVVYQLVLYKVTETVYNSLNPDHRNYYKKFIVRKELFKKRMAYKVRRLKYLYL